MSLKTEASEKQIDPLKATAQHNKNSCVVRDRSDRKNVYRKKHTAPDCPVGTIRGCEA